MDTMTSRGLRDTWDTQAAVMPLIFSRPRVVTT